MIIRYFAALPARGMALFPFILIKNRRDLTNARLLNHERIHIRQQLELLVIPFYVWYLINYAWNRLKGQDHFTAYWNICFEREAFANENDFGYLKRRRLWAFLRYG
jgi:hypothetical protein